MRIISATHTRFYSYLEMRNPYAFIRKNLRRLSDGREWLVLATRDISVLELGAQERLIGVYIGTDIRPNEGDAVEFIGDIVIPAKRSPSARGVNSTR